MGTWTMDGTDVGFLVDFPRDRAIGLFLFVVVVVRTIAGGGRFTCMGPHRHDSEEIDRLRHEVDDLREQMKKQQAAR